MLALPTAAPVTCGWLAGCVCPCRTVTLAGEIVSLDVSLLESATTVPPTGAAADKVTGNAIDCPAVTELPTGKAIVPVAPPAPGTVTVTVAGKTLGTLVVAVMTVLPGVSPVIRKFTPPEFCEIVIFEGSKSTAGLLDVNATGKPPGGAITESVNCMDCEIPALTVTFCWTKLIVAPMVAKPVPVP